jgi:pimeloyl-ACP methyl ester carboxylesterase
VLDTLQPPISWIAGTMARLQKVSRPIPGPFAAWMFANGMTKAQKRQVVAGLVKESTSLTRETVDRSAMPDRPTTWILTRRDNSLKPAAQRRFIANLGNVDEVIEVDTCHNVMMSEPDHLAALLIERMA